MKWGHALRACVVGWLALAGWAWAATTIQTLSMPSLPNLAPGTELVFHMTGTAGGQASLRMDGSNNVVTLSETSRGSYEGFYTLGSRDRVEPASQIRATLKAGGQTATASKTLQAASLPEAAIAPAAPAAASHGACATCGVVASVNVVEVEGQPGYGGAIAGGVAGAVLGSQIGRGNGSTAAGILGAVGGAYAGREVEKRMKREKRYNVVVRLDNGGTQTVQMANDPGLAAGTPVRIENGAVVRR